MKTFKINPLLQLVVFVILAMVVLPAFLSGCSSAPEPWDEEYKPDVPAALGYRIEKHAEVVDDEICVFPDGLYVEAPEWVCMEDKSGFAMGTYSMNKTNYQYARNMAYLYAVREVTRKTSEEIRSLAKAYGSSSGGGSNTDEEVIQGISFKIAKNVRVVKSIVSPNKDVYLLVRVDDVEDALENSHERAAWRAYKAEQAHKEMDSKYKEATWMDVQVPVAPPLQP